MQQDEEIILDAETSSVYTLEDLFKYSGYLCEEECHPLMWDLEGYVVNFEEVPDA